MYRKEAVLGLTSGIICAKVIIDAFNLYLKIFCGYICYFF